MGSSHLKILSLNVRGLNNPVKRRTVLNFLESSGAEICLLQETHLLATDTRRLRSRAFPTQLFSSGPKKTAGVAILLARSFRGTLVQKEAEIQGRLLTCRLQTGGHTLVVGSIYAPNEWQERFLHDALTDATAITERALLLGGDLNLVFDAALDRSAQRTSQVGALSHGGLRRLDELGIVDLWRSQHPQTRQYSHYSSAHKTYARIDYFLGSTHIQGLTVAVDILPAAISDHSPIVLSLMLPQVRPPTRCWRFRDSLLLQADTVTQLAHAIEEYFLHNDNSDTSLSTQWEAMKAVIRGEIIAISTADNIRRRQKRDELSQSVRELEQMHQRTGAPRIW